MSFEDHNNNGDKKIQEELAKKSKERFTANGYFGVTAKDHKNIGSTPVPKLLENPGKTLGEILTDDEILQILDVEMRAHKELMKMAELDPKKIEDIMGPIESYLNKFKSEINYLKSIGRLPEKYNDFLKNLIK